MSIKVKSIVTAIVRSLLGLIYVFFGLNFFLQFLPMPPPPAEPGAAETFMGGLFQAGYFFPMVKGLEVLLGGFLLLNFFTPLSLIILAPISLNIFLFHAFLAPANIGLSIVILVLHIFLFWAYKNSYRTVLNPKVLLS
jgi:putative oxidoreductase